MKRLIPILMLLFLPRFILVQVVDVLAGYNDPTSRLRGVIEKFDEDYGILNWVYLAQTTSTLH